MKQRLAIIASHPVQYYAPWFCHLAEQEDLEIKVFYLWDFGVREQVDRKFKEAFRWDVDLLEGYDYEFVPNVSADPGTHHFNGLDNSKLVDRILTWQPDVTLQFGYWYRTLLRFLWSSSASSIPKLIRGDSHDLRRGDGAKEMLKRMVQSVIFRKAAGFLYCGQANRDYFARRGVFPSRLFFCPHGVDRRRFRPDQPDEIVEACRREAGCASREKLVLFAGKFESKKRPLDLIHAFRQLSLPDVRLLIMGGGQFQERIEAEAAGDGRVRILPFQNQSSMPAWYAAADLFVLPSYGPDETWGLAVQEALACGTRVVVSDHVGCHADLVARSECGSVFQAGDIDGLATALRLDLERSRNASEPQVMQTVLDTYSYETATRGLREAMAAVKR